MNNLEGDLEGEDKLEAELHAESESRDAQRYSHKTASKRNSVIVMGLGVSKHLSYYALDGGTGQERWRHEGRDFHSDVADLAEQIIPQHNFRLTAKSPEGSHYGEVACKDYRESILGVLRHKWDSRIDTSLKLACFVRHQETQQEGKSGSKAPSARNKGALQGRPPAKHGVDHSSPVVKLFGQAAETATEGKASPAASPAYYQPYNPPNVLMAHLEEGIEAVDLLTGQTLCKLYLPPGGMHTGLNADGMLDHIQVTGRLHQGETHMQGDHKRGHACWVNALSGIPPHLHYFNGFLCLSDNGISNLLGSLQNGESAGPLQVLSPTVAPGPTTLGAHRRGWGTAVSLNSLGEMTAYDHHGKLLWQHAFNNLAWETWEASSELRNEKRSSPTSRAIPLQWGGIPTVVLASRDTHGAIVSQQGHLLDQFKLPERDFHRDVADLAEQTIPQQNVRLTAKSLEGTHYGGVACQHYRKSVLGVLPHKWDSRDGTTLKLAHFVRHREAQQEDKSGPKTASARNKGALQRRPPAKHGVDHSNPLVKLFGQAAETAAEGKATPAASPAYYQPYNPPNVLVAHLEEGVEAVDLLTRQTLCKMYLPPGGMHTDLNADGMLNHIQVTGRLHRGETHLQRGHKHGHACWVNAVSGIPPHLHYFNGPLCLSHNGISDLFGCLQNGEPAEPLQEGQSWERHLREALDKDEDLLADAVTEFDGEEGLKKFVEHIQAKHNSFFSSKSLASAIKRHLSGRKNKGGPAAGGQPSDSSTDNMRIKRTGLLSCHQLTEEGGGRVLWMNNTTKRDLVSTLRAIGAVGVLDMRSVTETGDLEIVNVSDVEFKENDINVYIFLDSPEANRVKMLEGWQKHVQRGLEVAASQYAAIRLAQAGKSAVQAFSSIEAPSGGRAR